MTRIKSSEILGRNGFIKIDGELRPHATLKLKQISFSEGSNLRIQIDMGILMFCKNLLKKRNVHYRNMMNFSNLPKKVTKIEIGEQLYAKEDANSLKTKIKSLSMISNNNNAGGNDNSYNNNVRKKNRS